MTKHEAHALAEVGRTAAADVAAYSIRGTPSYDDHRVGRMLARDEIVAKLATKATDRIMALQLALREACAGWLSEARTSDQVGRVCELLKLAGEP